MSALRPHGRVSLHVFLTPALHETRFLREAAALLRADLCDQVVLIAKWEPGLAVDEAVAPQVRILRAPLRTHRLPRRLPWQLLKGAEWSRQVSDVARRYEPDAIVAHSLGALGPARRAALRQRIPLLYDAHELETERNGLRGVRQRVERTVERRWIADCDAVVCVSEGIADWYATRYGIERPTVVRNLPLRGDAPIPTDRRLLRDKLGLTADALVFLYQGALFSGRRIEQLLRVFAGLPSTHHLVVMGYGPLEAAVRAAAEKAANVHFLPAVPPSEVLAHTAGADGGLVGVEAICESYRLSLPNKLFEYLAAGIPVVAPSYPEIARVVRTLDAGELVGEADEDWRRALLSWDRTVAAGRRAAAERWRAELDWTAESRLFTDAYAKLIAPPRGER